MFSLDDSYSKNNFITELKLENKTDNQLTLAQMRGGDGMLGYVMRPENKGKEMVFCIRGSVADNFSGGRIASVVYWQGSTIKNADAGKNAGG